MPVTLACVAFLIVTLLWMSIGAADDAPSPHVLAVDSRQVVCRSFLGFGAEWDSRGYDENGVTAEDFAVIAERIHRMKIPIVRMMMQTKWCCPDGRRFDWETPEMRALYRHLDLCRKEDITVLLTDWGCEPEWLRVPGIENVADPVYADRIGTYMDYLLHTRGYSCIRYFILVNEPNYEVKDWDRWKRGVENVAAIFAKRGIDRDVKLLGPDHSNDDLWLTRSVDQLRKVLGGYDVHRYANDRDVRPGNLEEYFAGQWRYVLANDAAAVKKPLIVGEAGMNDFAAHPSGNHKIGEFEYGVFMADYAVQAARAGSSAVCAWMMCDNSHPDFFWGLWSSKKKGIELRPWFYVWSLLTRYVPRGSVIYRMEQPSTDWRVLAARIPGAGGRNPSGKDGWTFCLVNRGDDEVRVRIQAPRENAEVKQYVYAVANSLVDDKGFPKPGCTEMADLRKGLRLNCPGNSVVIATTMND